MSKTEFDTPQFNTPQSDNNKSGIPVLPLSTHLDEAGHPMMVDVSAKKTTLREAEAEGIVKLTDAVLCAVRDNTAAKGDVLKIAELAGIMAAKRTPELIPLCHSIRLDSARVECVLDQENKQVRIRAQVKAADVTGVEMEALTAVSVAALTVYDMCKGIDKGMGIEGIRLLRKSGGKSGDYENKYENKYIPTADGKPHSHPSSGTERVLRAAVLTVSDKGSRGEREDTAGPALCGLLASCGMDIAAKAVVPDERPAIIDCIKEWIAQKNVQLVLTTGGTGLSSRDVTPDALMEIADRTVPGIGELMRSVSLRHTPNAPLSRGLAVTCGRCLIVALPGSRKGAEQCFEAVRPSLRHAIDILNDWSDEGRG